MIWKNKGVPLRLRSSLSLKAVTVGGLRPWNIQGLPPCWKDMVSLL